jgi:hypothetical protein
MIIHRDDPTGTWIVIRNIPDHVNEKSLKLVLLKNIDNIDIEKIAVVRFLFYLYNEKRRY